MRIFLLTFLLLAACEPQMSYIDLKEVRGPAAPKAFDASKLVLPAELNYCASQLPYYGLVPVPTKFPVEVLIDTSVTDRADALNVLDAAERWNTALDEDVFITVFTEHPSMQHMCNTAWVSAEDYSLKEPAVGLTSSTSCDKDRVLIDIVGTDGVDFKESLIVDIATHELGHVLGLGHEADILRSIMQPSLGDDESEISARSKCLVKIAEFLAQK